jgi:hypothetical protein
MTSIDQIARNTAERADLRDLPNPETGMYEPVIEDTDQLAAFIADGIRAYVTHGQIITAEDYTYTPVIDEHGIGYVVTSPTGHRETVTLVPSTATDEGPGTGNVFLYHSDDPHADGLGDALTHIAFTDPSTETGPVSGVPAVPKRTVRIIVEIPPAQAEFVTWGHIRHWIDQNTPSDARLLVRPLTGGGVVTWGDYDTGHARGIIYVAESEA